MNKIVACFALAMAACAGTDDLEFDDTGNIKQELVTQVSSTTENGCLLATGVMFEAAPLGGLSYGSQTCMDSNKEVFVPRTRSVSIRTSNSSCTTANFNLMVAQLDLIIAELNTTASIGGANRWTFTKSTTGTHTLSCASIPTSPVGASSIRNLVRVIPPVNPTLVTDSDSVYDGAVIYGLGATTIQIDGADVVAKGANATEDARVMWQAVAHGVEKLAGVGEFAGNRMAASDTDWSTASGRVMFSTGERCRTREYATTQNLNYFRSSSAGCPEN